MRIIQVASLPLNEVIQDIARALDTDFERHGDEYKLLLPKQIGEGSITGTILDGGLGIIQYKCTFIQDTEIQFVVNKVHPIKFLYVLDGKLYHRFEEEEKPHALRRFQNAIVASRNRNGHVVNFKANCRTYVYSLEINREKFNQKASYINDDMNATLKNLFTNNESEESFYYEGDYSLKMADLFNEIDEFEGSDFLHMVFMESIAYQILLQQISQFLDDQKQEKNRTVLRHSEVDAVAKAAEYIHNNLSTYKSIRHLTRITGLNPAKLQDGFKYLYDKTINQYVYKVRLDLAKDLLTNTDDSISEIVYKIGLSSKSYFSRIFKEEYGMQPSTFRNRKRESDESIDSIH